MFILTLSISLVYVCVQLLAEYILFQILFYFWRQQHLVSNWDFVLIYGKISVVSLHLAISKIQMHCLNTEKSSNDLHFSAD